MLISHWEMKNIYCIIHILTKTPMYEYHIDIHKIWQGGGVMGRRHGAMKEHCVAMSVMLPTHTLPAWEGSSLWCLKRQFPMKLVDEKFWNLQGW